MIAARARRFRAFDLGALVLAAAAGCDAEAPVPLTTTTYASAPPTPASSPGAPTNTIPPVSAAAPATQPAPPGDIGSPPADLEALRPGIRWRKDRSSTNTTRPEPTDRVRWRRMVWRPDGLPIQDTFTAPEAPVDPIAGLPPSARAALLQLSPGDVATLWVDAEVDGPGTPPTVHRLEVIEVLPGKRAPRLRGEPTTAPPDARRISASTVCTTLRAGTGTRPPGPKEVLRHTIECYGPDMLFVAGTSPDAGPSEIPLSAMSPGGRLLWKSKSAGEVRRCFARPGADLGLGEPSPLPLVCDLTLIGTRALE